MEKIRYCFECGHIGQVRDGAISCCPDGKHAVEVPMPLAMQAKRGFHTSTLRVKLDGSYGRDIDGHWFYLCPADKYAARALFERGELPPNLEFNDTLMSLNSISMSLNTFQKPRRPHHD